MNSFFLAAAVIIFKGIYKMQILGVGKIGWQLYLAVYAMSITYIQNCTDGINVLVLVAGVRNQLVAEGNFFCKNLVPGNKVGVAVAKNYNYGIAVVTCKIWNCRVAVLF